ncbi:DEKNAAC100092 [Brettanomyces naardenensis]|uniref:DEKNAAC100092 n=1 Tax=Brettanomyces naardenensis TaxID=13370 RepID=A0A448YGC9_BRENA|nr:DEKNAAC100092 [Brettanomyces naardenensis]
MKLSPDRDIPTAASVVKAKKATQCCKRKKKASCGEEEEHGYDASGRIELLLNEIDRLKSLLFERSSGWIQPELAGDVRAKDIRILRGIRKAHLRPLAHLSDRCVRVDRPNSSIFLGPSSFRTFIVLDPNLGRLTSHFRQRMERERYEWRQSFQTRQDHDSMSHQVDIRAAAIQQTSFSNVSPRQAALVSILEDYLVDYDLFIQLLNSSLAILSALLPVTPRYMMNDILLRRFQRVPGSNKVKILITGHPAEFAEICLVIGSLKFGYTSTSGSDSPAASADNTFNIYTEGDTNLLYFFATNLLEEAEYRTFATLPTLLSLITLYFIALRNVEKYDFVTFENIPSFQSTTVQMAISLGFHRDRSETNPLYIHEENSSSNPNLHSNSSGSKNLIRLLTTEDWHTIWSAVMYLDSMGSFNLGIPSMVGYTADRCYGTGRYDSTIRYVIGAYRTVIRLITGPSPQSQQSDKSGDPSVTIFQLEKIISGIEDFNNTKLATFKHLIDQMRETEKPEDVAQLLLSVLLKLRICALLLFLYIHSHMVFRDSNNDLIRVGRLFGKSLEEVKGLEIRLFKRSFKFAVLMLGLLNHLLLNNCCRKVTALGVFSTDLSSLFIRCIYVLCSYVCEALEKQQYESKVTLRIDDLSLDTLELLMNSDNEDSPDPAKSSEYKENMSKIEQFYDHPASLLHYVNGFYFNSSRSTIAKDYNFFASYKYLFLCLNSMENNRLTVETFDTEKFLAEFKNIDSSWFSG